jgi:hypothetical protein
MALFDKLRNSGTLSLKGNSGPNFENEGQRTSSNIQALTNHNVLVESQDLKSGRTYGNSPNRIRIAPSKLDIDGKTPQQYVNTIGAGGSTQQSSTFYSATGTGFLLEKRLPFSGLGLQGLSGPTFENESQRAVSDIQALSKNNVIQSSQDLFAGRNYGKGRFTVFVPHSLLNTGGNPLYPAINGGTYKAKGPREGRY